MTTNSVFSVIVASYISSEEARADLSGLDDLFWTSPLSAFDAALIVTDAWGQVRVDSHKSQDDALIGPLNDAFTKLFGGPFIGGVAPPLPKDPRVPHNELMRIGDAMGPSSVKSIALTLGEHEMNRQEIFPRAEAVRMESVESSTEKLEDLASTVVETIRSLRKESSQHS